MSLTSRLAALWEVVARRGRAERELDEELAAYVELLVEEKMRAGMPAAAARRAALVEVGGVAQVKEAVRDDRPGVALETLAQDARYAARSLARTPGFAAAAVLALALGIGANTAIFSVVDAVLLRPLPYEDAGRLVTILHHGDDPVAVANFLDWRREARSFASMGAADYWTPSLTGSDRPEKLWALRLTADVLPMLGVPPLLGRTFTAQEEAPGRAHVVVLGYGLWQRRFAGDPGVVGRAITLDGESYAVIGVMPRGFRFAPYWATRAELWAPDVLAGREAQRGGNSLRVFARLAPGVSLGSARAEMATIAARLERAYPGTNREVTVLPLKEKVVGDVRPALLVLLGAVACVLLIACANVAHMLLARAAARRREMAVRTALGASRGRVVRQLLTESVMLSLAGGTAGVLLAWAGVRALVALAPGDVPRLDTVSLDARVLAATLAVSLLTGIGFGLAPALQASAVRLGEALKEGGRGNSDGAGRQRLRSLLVASEFALALVLLVGAGLMIRSFAALQRIDPGFDPRGVLSVVVSAAGTADGAPGRRAEFYQEVVRRVRALPGVRAAGAINHLPLAGDIWGFRFWVEGRPLPRPGEVEGAAFRVVLPGYFETMRLPLVRGRAIDARDRGNAPGVVVVNETLARHVWPGEDPLGKRISLDDPAGGAPSWLTVVGVTKDARLDRWAGEAWNELYVPYLQTRMYLEDPGSHVGYMTLVVRGADASDATAAALAPAVRRAVWELDRDVALSEVQTMPQVVAMATAAPRFYLLLLGCFAAAALTLAAVGIYGVMSYAVSRRTHELGIRMALGAGRAQVLRLVIGQGVVVALAGAAAGLVGALLLTRLMASLLYGVGATDPATFAAVWVVLTGVAVVASYVPARRAARIDPLVALRSE